MILLDHLVRITRVARGTMNYLHRCPSTSHNLQINYHQRLNVSNMTTLRRYNLESASCENLFYDASDPEKFTSDMAVQNDIFGLEACRSNGHFYTHSCRSSRTAERTNEFCQTRVSISTRIRPFSGCAERWLPERETIDSWLQKKMLRGNFAERTAGP